MNGWNTLKALDLKCIWYVDLITKKKIMANSHILPEMMKNDKKATQDVLVMNGSTEL